MSRKTSPAARLYISPLEGCGNLFFELDHRQKALRSNYLVTNDEQKSDFIEEVAGKLEAALDEASQAATWRWRMHFNLKQFYTPEIELYKLN